MKIVLKWKIWQIENSLKKQIKSRGIKPNVWSFGAYYIDPKNIVFVAGVQTDEEKEKLKTDIKIQNQMKELLERFNWPLDARKYVTFDIESQETVNRETNGNWWYHYK
jgi:hypothetical protein